MSKMSTEGFDERFDIADPCPKNTPGITPVLSIVTRRGEKPLGAASQRRLSRGLPMRQILPCPASREP